MKSVKDDVMIIRPGQDVSWEFSDGGIRRNRQFEDFVSYFTQEARGKASKYLLIKAIFVRLRRYGGERKATPEYPGFQSIQ